MDGLGPVPPSDGAPMRCTLHKNLATWPYVTRCKNEAAGLLTPADYKMLVDHRVNLGGRLICQEHYDAAKAGELE